MLRPVVQRGARKGKGAENRGLVSDRPSLGLAVRFSRLESEGFAGNSTEE